jgi:hypothetical protein
MPTHDPATTDYEDAWESVQGITHIGRYMGIKLLEFFRLASLMSPAIPDIRPAGAWSPRRGLTYLYPTETPRLTTGGDGPDTLAFVNDTVDDLDDYLQHTYGVVLTKFELEVFLCEYRQVFERRKQYPGKPLDSELAFATALREHWGDDYLQAVLDVRRRLFQPWALGEHGNRWTGVRKELGGVLAAHGYMWSDSLYDYTATRDLSRPVRQQQ